MNEDILRVSADITSMVLITIAIVLAAIYIKITGDKE